jgi:elongation factor G
MRDVPSHMMEEALEWRTKLLESVAGIDDTLLERYLEDHDAITPDEINEVLRKSTLKGTVVPVLCGAAFKNKGVQRLLDAVVSLMSELLPGTIQGMRA